jgi:ABC-type uncharacterized transport system permease subunit
MKTKFALSGLFFAVSLIAAWNVAPAAAAAILFAFFMAASITCASFALRSNDPEIREALDGKKGGRK